MNIRIWLSVFLLPLIFCFNISFAQQAPEFSTYYEQRLTHFEALPHTKSDVIFLGNSLTDGGEWSEWFHDTRMKNRGISGDVTAGVIHRLKEVTARRPEKIFLLIGVNDLSRGLGPDSVAENILTIAKAISLQSPATRLYVQSILPVNDEFEKFPSHVNKTGHILQVNRKVQKQAEKYGYTYIDLYSAFCNPSGKLDKKYTNDGLHLLGDGYLLWQHLIYPYIYEAGMKPALIPLPQQVDWGTGFFTLYQCDAILVKDKELTDEGVRLQKLLNEKGWRVPVKQSARGKVIELKLEKIDAPRNGEEAYELIVSADKITIKAGTARGIFYGIQTLEQLLWDGKTIPAGAIKDWPAFAWRGYMIDVGRNYMPVDLLKQQIEVMAKYKLNIFHFHFTEDIAWRLAIKQYPQLTDASTMLRNPGKYYTPEEFQELIDYCKERHVTLVPEIDMPGHSAAFKRAMKTDMQTDSGLAIVKNILKEFFDTYNLPYIHIGADEVKITMENFLPEVIEFIHQYNKQIVGWEPGGNFTNDVIRQLWMENAAEKLKNTPVKYIDSRHLYINHMDPLEAVTTIFFRQIGDKKQGDSSLIGATLCLWPDRRVEEPMDALKQNPLYPGLVTFSERVWRGGGISGWTALIGSPGSARAKEFSEFEDRLLNHKRQYFSSLPFPYVAQSPVGWTLYGPYSNGGNLQKEGLPELKGFDTLDLKVWKKEVGGTLVLRHWWYPAIAGVVDSPETNATVYAHRRIWSDTGGYRSFWIGFNNLSRSPSTDSPPLGQWDFKQSKVWVNQHLVSPPVWKRAGMGGHAEVPLTDEGYEYRSPTEVYLKKGWNDIWIKAPVGSFSGPNWHNPVKWMFTFVEAK